MLHPTGFLLFYVGFDIFLTVGSFGFYNPDGNFDLHEIWKVMNVWNYNFFYSPFDFLLLTLLRVLLIIGSMIFTRIGKGKKVHSLVLDHGILSTSVFIFAVFKSELPLVDPILTKCPGVYFNVLVTTVFNFTVTMVIKHLIINGAVYQRLEVEGMANVENAAALAVAEEADSTPLFQQFKLIVKILWVQKKYLVPTLVLIAIWCITYIIVTAIAGELIASLSGAKNLMIIVLGALSYGWFNFMRYSSQRLKSIFLAKTQKNVSRDLQKRLFAAVLRQEIGYFDTIRTGDLSSRLTSEYKSISEDMPEQFCVLIETFLFTIMSIIWMSSITWNLTIVILSTLPILIKVAQIEAKYKGELSKKITEKTSERNGIIQEVVSGVRIVRSHAAEQQEIGRHGEVVDTVEDLEEKMKKLDAMFAFVWGMIWLVTMFIVFVYAGYLLEQKRMKPENIVTFIYFLFTLQDAIVKLAVIFSKVVKTIGTSYNVIQLLNRQPEFNYDEGTQTPNLTGNIEKELSLLWRIVSRLSTIRHADRIVYIEKGEVKEVGSHDDLMAKRGLYAKLVEKQTRRESGTSR